MARRDPSQRAKQRNAYLRKKYGISAVEYDKLFAAQNGVCAVCGRPPGRVRLAVDHCHKTERQLCSRLSVRGLVHNYPCNYVLLRKQFTPALLRSAADYLEQSHARTQAWLSSAG